ncbi:uncharacterized protein C8Q71DRAFT_208109 [Rhodofomes roseus]|uniref:TFIIB-type domain-containing protein n=1 Tax=Rhodofomes roseus TaxID=34475 RepID=A0ABQ8KW73_9APHY|nr:uncharacterized protein C8Q71DRAFT_208109 [Rhodofomes roseus]KAH9842545.1 hypothetical protein C8Q71DRAFT_208109 [Rhodofomes roseus]
MSRGRCAECNGPTEWDENVGSAICVECGTLADPTQSVLTTHHDFLPDTAHGPWTTFTTSLKNRKGWTLPGQSQDASHTRNTLAIYEFIQTLAMRLSARGATERAQILFDQAMARERFRWGRQSKRMAGAALAVALRESKRNDALRDIAYLLEESPAALGRAFISLARILSLNVSPADPTVHLSTLHNHLVSLTQGPSSNLPDKLRTTLEDLRPRMLTIMQTADSLCALLSRTDVLVKMPPPPTACAVMMLAIEAELKSSLPHTGLLAQLLGSRFDTAKVTVMQRYKIIYDLVEEWIREVPWLDAHERKNGGTGRSKVAKRVVVARGLKDVLQFQDEISAKKMEAQAMPRLDLEMENPSTDDKEELEDDPDTDGRWRFCQDNRRRGDAVGTSSASTHVVRKDVVNSRPPLKKWKTSHERSVARASEFLLDPLRSQGSGGSGAQSAPPRARRPSGRADLDLLSHILTADASSLPHVFANAPSRLQLLAASRACESDIPDEELFADGELDGLLRSAEEAGQLRTALGWDEEEEDASGPPLPQKQRKKRKRGADEEDGGGVGGSKRINMDALAKLLDPSLDLAAEYVFGDKNDYLADDDEEDADDENAEHAPRSFFDGVEDPDMPPSAQLEGGADEGEIVEEWRPMSPGGGGYDADRYV